MTFNLVVYVPQDDGTEKDLYRWKATEVYGLINGSWKLVHSHWSYTKQVETLV
ncbi:MAG: hypothetical protein OEZ52_01015 [Candidatus Aminicenantes bacterium]|nr:hypothetical protein [Candidatus Aminicenantes bacterium]MDH5742103.1 hypothetical protein [Candidatus Aminicenantes bacterium]